jgi:signal peptidase I
VRLLARGYLVFVLALAACAIVPMVTGLAPSVVQSGSMMPLIRVGDVVLSRPLAADAATPLGRVITFPAPPGSAEPGMRLHRVVGVNPDGTLITAGDANPDVDSAPLSRVDVIAVSSILVPWIGLPAFWVQHGLVLFFAAWLVLSLLALAIEFLASRSESRTGRPRRSRRPRHPRSIMSAVAGRWNSGGTFSVLSLVICAALVVVAPAAPSANAAFTAQTVSGGSSWTALVAATATKLTFTTSPSNSTGGAPFGIQPAVAIQGSHGESTTSTAPVTLAITVPGGATLGCTANSLAAVTGRVQFSGCAVNRAGTYTLTATSAGLSAAISASFTIAVGSPTQLEFTTSPGNTARSTAFASQPVVAVEDAGGNTVTTSTLPVTLAITNPGGASLTNCAANPKNSVAGVATFSGCRITQTGNYTLTATSGTVQKATSAAISIFVSASKLAFLGSPSSSVSSTAFGAQPIVAIQDSGGNTTSGANPITLSITSPAAATLSCTSNPNSAVNGVATFSGCSIGKAGTYTLTAMAIGLSSAISASFTISVGAASRLTFTSSPSSAVSATTFATQPVVTVLDAFGNSTTSTAAVTLMITAPGGAALSCTSNPKAAVAGVAAFAGCRIDRAGAYTLTASANGVASAVSGSFSITPGPAARVVFTTSPGASLAGVSNPIQPVVAIQDAAGNLVSTALVVTLTITAPSGGAALSCSSNPRVTSGGVAAFSGCRIDRAGTYSLTVGSFLLVSGVSASFVVT